MRHRSFIVLVCGLLGTAAIGYLAGSASGSGAGDAGRTITPTTPAFSHAVFLSHRNDPSHIPVFPGDPPFRLSTAFTVKDDGFYLQYVKEGEHTGTHYSAPCHFHVRARCADELDPADFILPAVVVDIRNKVKGDVDYHVTVADLKAWESAHGAFPAQSAVLLWTGCDRYWGPEIGPEHPDVLQLRQRGRSVPPAGLLEVGRPLADRPGGPGSPWSPRKRHLRPRSR
jgi:putative cyclase